MGWSLKNSGVVLNDELINYLNIFASKLPFDIVVTSGVRTPERQAKAMFYKIEQGEDITKLYRDKTFAESVIDAYPDLNKGARAVQAYIDRGGGRTMHLSGRAVDIRTRDKTQEQLDLMIQVVNDMGDRPLYEPVPPHLDISLRNDYTLPGQPSSTDKKKGLNRLVLLGIVGALIWMN